jgi:hypothetical protein
MSLSLKNILQVGVLLIAIVSCKNDDPEPKGVVVSKMLSNGAWTIETVTADNINLTENFTSMELQFFPNTYRTTAGGLLWPTSGTWAFTSQQANAILRDGDIVVTIVELTSSKLVLTFTWSGTLGQGKVKSIAGDYTFVFIR